MGIGSWVLMGLIAGLVAKRLMPTREPQGCLRTVLVGIAGGIVGGFLGTWLGWGKVDEFDLRSLLLAIGGTLLLLYVHRVLTGSGRP
ncbi:MAG: GlsB/YeaQ/YmgE family stress response membrane protein [Planctomycetales bacterium]